jgi:hypothetical protein
VKIGGTAPIPPMPTSNIHQAQPRLSLSSPAGPPLPTLGKVIGIVHGKPSVGRTNGLTSLLQLQLQGDQVSPTSDMQPVHVGELLPEMLSYRTISRLDFAISQQSDFSDHLQWVSRFHVLLPAFATAAT